MLEADEPCTPDIVEDNYTPQVMSTNLEYQEVCSILCAKRNIHIHNNFLSNFTLNMGS